MKRLFFLPLLSLVLATALLPDSLTAQKRTSFAWLTDTHLAENAASIGELQACIDDINALDSIDFVIFTGDITEFGSDREIRLAADVLGRLRKPWYTLAGNHDAKWSESGCNTFAKTFGYEHFSFEAGGVRFIGTNSGPNMRMAPALLPRESVVWLDSIARTMPREQPVIFFNHYPLDTSMLNSFQVLDLLKTMNVQLAIGGHWHRNTVLSYEGIPGILGRSTQARGQAGPGYNIVTLTPDSLFVCERTATPEGGIRTRAPWFRTGLHRQGTFAERNAGVRFPLLANRPDYSGNADFPQVREIWTVQDNSDIGSGAVTDGKSVVYANTRGTVRCLNLRDGSLRWEFPTGSKIYSTPAVSRNRVVFGCSDNRVYCLDLKTGQPVWEHAFGRSVLGSPVIRRNTVFIGGSDSTFRALDLKTGEARWICRDIRGFVEARAWADDEQVVIGDWANTLYSLDPETGALQWKWQNRGSRMLSPAAVWPVKAADRIFFVTPERKTYALDAATGAVCWSVRGGRESIGLSNDGKTVFVKVMKDSVYAYRTDTPQAARRWGTDLHFGYEIAPTPITCSLPQTKGKAAADETLVFIPTDKGKLFAVRESDGSLVWAYRLSFALINYILPLPERRILVSTMDGKVSLLTY